MELPGGGWTLIAKSYPGPDTSFGWYQQTYLFPEKFCSFFRGNLRSSGAYSFDILNYARSSGWNVSQFIFGSHDTTDGSLNFNAGDEYYLGVSGDISSPTLNLAAQRLVILLI